MNVNSTGAKAIVYAGTTAASTYMWYPNAVVEFIYDGTSYVMQNAGYATTTYYGVTKLSSSTSSTSTTLAATASAVKSAYDLASSNALSGTVGSTTQPIYLNDGVITECGDSLDIDITGTAETINTNQGVNLSLGINLLGSNSTSEGASSVSLLYDVGSSSETHTAQIVQGTASTTGAAQINLGNAIATGTVGNSTGYLSLFSDSGAYGNITAKNVTANKTYYLNNAGGTLVTHTTQGTAVGSSIKPIYISSTGAATASSSTVGNASRPVYLNAGTITAMTGTLSMVYGGTGNSTGTASYCTTYGASIGTSDDVAYVVGATSADSTTLLRNNSITMSGSYMTLTNTTDLGGSTAIKVVGYNTSADYAVSLHVGSGGTNRGIYDHKADNWIIYRDDNNQTNIYGPKTLIYPSTSYTTSSTGIFFQVQMNASATMATSTSSTNATLCCGTDSTSSFMRSYATYSRTGSTAANVNVTSSGTFNRYSSSASRYKNTINYFDNIDSASDEGLAKRDYSIEESNYREDYRSILKLPVVQFHYNEGYMTGEPDYDYTKFVTGFIAEDVEKNCPECATYTEEGEIEAWDHMQMIPRMVAMIQELNNRVIDLEEKIVELTA